VPIRSRIPKTTFNHQLIEFFDHNTVDSTTSKTYRNKKKISKGIQICRLIKSQFYFPVVAVDGSFHPCTEDNIESFLSQKKKEKADEKNFLL
jgi:hypothetical protein